MLLADMPCPTSELAEIVFEDLLVGVLSWRALQSSRNLLVPLLLNREQRRQKAAQSRLVLYGCATTVATVDRQPRDSMCAGMSAGMCAGMCADMYVRRCRLC